MYRSLSISMYSLNKTTMDDFTTSFKSDFITSSFIFSKSRLNCNWVIINSSYFVFVVENIVSQGVNMTLFVYPFLLHNYMDLIPYCTTAHGYCTSRSPYCASSPGHRASGCISQYHTVYLLVSIIYKYGQPFCSLIINGDK